MDEIEARRILNNFSGSLTIDKMRAWATYLHFAIAKTGSKTALLTWLNRIRTANREQDYVPLFADLRTAFPVLYKTELMVKNKTNEQLAQISWAILQRLRQPPRLVMEPEEEERKHEEPMAVAPPIPIASSSSMEEKLVTNEQDVSLLVQKINAQPEPSLEAVVENCAAHREVSVPKMRAVMAKTNLAALDSKSPKKAVCEAVLTAIKSERHDSGEPLERRIAMKERLVDMVRNGKEEEYNLACASQYGISGIQDVYNKVGGVGIIGKRDKPQACAETKEKIKSFLQQSGRISPHGSPKAAQPAPFLSKARPRMVVEQDVPSISVPFSDGRSRSPLAAQAAPVPFSIGRSRSPLVAKAGRQVMDMEFPDELLDEPRPPRSAYQDPTKKPCMNPNTKEWNCDDQTEFCNVVKEPIEDKNNTCEPLIREISVGPHTIRVPAHLGGRIEQQVQALGSSNRKSMVFQDQSVQQGALPPPSNSQAINYWPNSSPVQAEPQQASRDMRQFIENQKRALENIQRENLEKIQRSQRQIEERQKILEKERNENEQTIQSEEERIAEQSRELDRQTLSKQQALAASRQLLEQQRVQQEAELEQERVQIEQRTQEIARKLQAKRQALELARRQEADRQKVLEQASRPAPQAEHPRMAEVRNMMEKGRKLLQVKADGIIANDLTKVLQEEKRKEDEQTRKEEEDAEQELLRQQQAAAEAVKRKQEEEAQLVRQQQLIAEAVKRKQEEEAELLRQQQASAEAVKRKQEDEAELLRQQQLIAEAVKRKQEEEAELLRQQQASADAVKKERDVAEEKVILKKQFSVFSEEAPLASAKEESSQIVEANVPLNMQDGGEGEEKIEEQENIIIPKSSSNKREAPQLVVSSYAEEQDRKEQQEREKKEQERALRKAARKAEKNSSKAVVQEIVQQEFNKADEAIRKQFNSVVSESRPQQLEHELIAVVEVGHQEEKKLEVAQAALEVAIEKAASVPSKEAEQDVKKLSAVVSAVSIVNDSIQKKAVEIAAKLPVSDLEHEEKYNSAYQPVEEMIPFVLEHSERVQEEPLLNPNQLSVFRQERDIGVDIRKCLDSLYNSSKSS